MTVKELKKALANLPDDMEVILQQDPEGNGYSPLSVADPNCIWDEDGRDVYSLEWSADDAGMTDDEWEEVKSWEKALVLAPKY